MDGYSSDQMRSFVIDAGVAAFCVAALTCFVQWLSARRLSAAATAGDRWTTWRVWSVRSLRGLFVGAGFMFAATPFGYIFIKGSHAFWECASVTMPCLAGMVVGFALLKTRFDVPRKPGSGKSASKMAKPTAPRLEHGPVDEEAPGACTCACALRAAKADGAGNDPDELRYYAWSVLFIFFGYLAYLLANPSKAIAVWVILGFAWFAVAWLGWIWFLRRRYDLPHHVSGFIGFVVILALVFLLGFLSCSAAHRWEALLPAPGNNAEGDHSETGCQADGNQEEHVIPSTPAGKGKTQTADSHDDSCK
jgi:hypothetical protein